VAYDLRGRDEGSQFEGPHETANIRAGSGGSSRSYVAFAQNQREEVREMDVSGALAAEPGVKQQTYVAFSCKDNGADAIEDAAPTMRAMGHGDSHANAGGQLAVAHSLLAKHNSSHAADQDSYVAHALRGEGFDASEDGTGRGIPLVSQTWAVRRLTPLECERLQGFPDNYTRVPGASKGGWRDVDPEESVEALEALGLNLRLKGNTWRVQDPDGPRYKALGNSMAVNVMRWIGERIAAVDALDSAESVHAASAHRVAP
jgi:DNA (cytosine-5)-methyltransferase 1